jgi:hypothetical protein
MSSVPITFTFKPRGQTKQLPSVETPIPTGNIPRASRLMALALHFESLRRRGLVTDYADMARLGEVTRARITQIMSLINLAPDIQEDVLYLPRTQRGWDPVTVKKLIPIAQELDWATQRQMWSDLKNITFSKVSG